MADSPPSSAVPQPEFTAGAERCPARAPVRAYALAFGLVFAAFLVRAAAADAVGQRPLLILFIGPILLASYFGGFGPGLFATGLSGLGTALFAVPPTFLRDPSRWEDWLQWGLLLGSGVGISLLVDKLHGARRAAEHRADVEAALSEHRRGWR